MNGPHDLGGQHGFGPIEREADEPVFHAAWEGRVLACFLATGAWRKWNIDRGRMFREAIGQVRYLTSGYYQIWYHGLAGLLTDSGLVSAGELESGKADPDAVRRTPGFTAGKVVPALRGGGSTRRPDADAVLSARFAPGDAVVARNINPRGHTRIPRYVRGRTGTVARVHGTFVFPDSNAALAGEAPQTVYSVRFAARELWGPDAERPGDKVHVDLWESYLDPA